MLFRSPGAPKIRRVQIESTLKELDDKRKKVSSPPLMARIAKAGLTWDKRTFMIFSGGTALAAFVLLIVLTGNLLVAAAGAFTAGFGFPRWMLGYLKKRRETKFLENFPNSVDIIVRGIKAGLPLLDSMKIIGETSAFIDGIPHVFVAGSIRPGEVVYVNGAVGMTLTIASVHSDGRNVPLTSNGTIQLIDRKSTRLNSSH